MDLEPKKDAATFEINSDSDMEIVLSKTVTSWGKSSEKEFGRCYIEDLWEQSEGTFIAATSEYQVSRYVV